MKMTRSIVAAMAAMMFTPATAQACRMATRQHVPTEKPADVIVEGFVTAVDTSEQYDRSATVHVKRRWLGREKPKIVQIAWSVGGGMCGPPGPAPEAGQRLLVYLKTLNGKLWPIGWSVIDKKPDGSVIRQQNEAAAQWDRSRSAGGIR